jgi:hypothetical protein
MTVFDEITESLIEAQIKIIKGTKGKALVDQQDLDDLIELLYDRYENNDIQPNCFEDKIEPLIEKIKKEVM